MSDRDREADHARRKALHGVCRSWRIRWGNRLPRIVRCSWPADHVESSKWHCAEDTTGHVWLVTDRERGISDAPTEETETDER